MFRQKVAWMQSPAFWLLLTGLFCSDVGAETAVIRLAGSGWVADAPTKVADLNGYFNRHTDAAPIRVLYFNSGKEALDALLAGDVEVALAATSPVAIELLRASTTPTDPDHELVILASVSLSNQSHYLVAAADRGVQSVEDLHSRRVGVMWGTSGHFAWYRFAQVHGLDKQRITLVDIPVSDHSTRLLAGDVDAVMSWDPWGLQVQQALGERAALFSAREIHTVDWLLVTRRGLALENPDQMDRILEGYQQAIAFIREQPEAARQLHADFSGLPVADLISMEQGIIWRLALNWSVVANVEAQFQWLATWPEYDGAALPAPAQYLYAAPLNRVAPGVINLPAYMYHLD